MTVCLHGRLASCAIETTDAHGVYAAANLLAGTYDVQVYPHRAALTSPAALVTLGAQGVVVENFTLRASVPIPHGLTLNGATSGPAMSFWQSPTTAQVALRPLFGGRPGDVGATVVTFEAEPTSGSPLQVAQAMSSSWVIVYYRYDSAGVPRFLAQVSPSTYRLSPKRALGTWSVNVDGVPTPGATDARSLTVTGIDYPAASPFHGDETLAVFQHELVTTGTLAGTPDRAARSASPARAAAGPSPSAIPTDIGEMQNLQITADTGWSELGSDVGALSPGTDLTDAPCSDVSGPPPPSFGPVSLPNGDTWDPSTGAINTPSGTIVPTIVTGNGTGIPFNPGGPFIPAVGIMSATGDTNHVVYPGRPQTIDGTTITPNEDGSFSIADKTGTYTFDVLPDSTWELTHDSVIYNSYGRIGTGGWPLSCPPASPLDVTNKVDPSGAVVSVTRVPIPGARVVIARSATRHGKPRPVRNGDAATISPARNPELTAALGGFAWDAIPGFYRITATRHGCSPPQGRRAASTRLLRVPPPRIGLRITLRCRGLRRASTRTLVRKRAIGGGQTMVVVIVAAGRGGHHRPVGLIALRIGKRTIATAPLGSPHARASLTLTRRAAAHLRAWYLGDGYNAASHSK